MELPAEVAKKRKEAKSRKDKERRNKLNKEFQNIVRNDKKQYRNISRDVKDEKYERQAFEPALENEK